MGMYMILQPGLGISYWWDKQLEYICEYIKNIGFGSIVAIEHMGVMHQMDNRRSPECI